MFYRGATTTALVPSAVNLKSSYQVTFSFLSHIFLNLAIFIFSWKRRSWIEEAKENSDEEAPNCRHFWRRIERRRRRRCWQKRRCRQRRRWWRRRRRQPRRDVRLGGERSWGWAGTEKVRRVSGKARVRSNFQHYLAFKLSNCTKCSDASSSFYLKSNLARLKNEFLDDWPRTQNPARRSHG